MPPFWIVSMVWKSAIWGLKRRMRSLSFWISQSLERSYLIVTGGSGKRFYLKKCSINGNMTMWIVREYIAILRAVGKDCWIKSLSIFGKSKERSNFHKKKIFSAVRSKNTLYICQHLALLIFVIILPVFWIGSQNHAQVIKAAEKKLCDLLRRIVDEISRHK